MKLIKYTKSNTATFVVLEPQTPDRNGDIISEEEIIKTAHEFMLNIDKKKVNINHKNGSDLSSVFFVESFVAPQDIALEKGVIKKGSWLVGMKFPDDIFKKITSGEISGISMEGRGFEKL